LIANGVTITFNKASSTTTTITTPTSPVAATCVASNFTTAAFNAIQLGMTLSQVNQTLGCANDPFFTQRNIYQVTHAWSAQVGGSIIVYFDAAGTIVTGINGSNMFKSSSGF
jgi:hypothetical protein